MTDQTVTETDIWKWIFERLYSLRVYMILCPSFLSGNETNQCAFNWKRNKVTHVVDLDSLKLDSLASQTVNFFSGKPLCQWGTVCAIETLFPIQELWQMIVCLTPYCFPVSATTWYVFRLNSTLVSFLGGLNNLTALFCLFGFYTYLDTVLFEFISL